MRQPHGGRRLGGRRPEHRRRRLPVAGAWQVYGGTSVASPLVAAIFTLLDLSGQTPQFAWTHTSRLLRRDLRQQRQLRHASSARPASATTARPGGARRTARPSREAAAAPAARAAVEQRRQLRAAARLQQQQQQLASSSSSGAAAPAAARARAAARAAAVELSGSSSGSSSSSSSGAAAAAAAAAARARTRSARTGTPLTEPAARAPTTSARKDPYCCQTQWDSICVSEVPEYCPGDSCTGGGGGSSSGGSSSGSSSGSSGGSSSGGGGGSGTCSHAVCNSGKPLAETCSTCADDVCTKDPYCCSALGQDLRQRGQRVLQRDDLPVNQRARLSIHLPCACSLISPGSRRASLGDAGSDGLRGGLRPPSSLRDEPPSHRA